MEIHFGLDVRCRRSGLSAVEEIRARFLKVAPARATIILGRIATGGASVLRRGGDGLFRAWGEWIYDAAVVRSGGSATEC